MATYYVAQGGTAANKAAATSGTYPGGCMSPDTGSNESYSPGDSILFSDQGGEIQRTGSLVFSVATSGTSGVPITYGAKSGETPVLTGQYDLTSATYKWTASGSGTNEYYCEIAAGGDPNLADSHLLRMDDVVLVESNGDSSTAPALGSLSDHEWGYGDNDTLGYDTYYVRDDTGNPDTSGVEILSPQKGCFNVYEKDHIIVDGITCNYGYNPNGSLWVGDCDDVVIQNCEAHYNGSSGIMIKSGSTNCTVDSCTTSYNGAHNIAAGASTGVTFSNNTSHHARITLYTPSPYDGYGLKFLTCTDGKMFGNTVYSNEFQGIDLDINADDNEIYENKIYDNGSSGILIELTSLRNKVYRNLLYDNYGYDIHVNSNCTHNDLYHNVIYRTAETTQYPVGFHAGSTSCKFIGNTIDVGAHATRCMAASTESTAGMVVKNNIFYGGTSYTLLFDSVSHNYTGFECDYNLHERDNSSSSTVRFDGATYTIINGGSGTWYTSKGYGQNSLEEDPVFTNEGTHDYTLQSTSPCIGAGVDLGTAYADALDPSSAWPDSVTTANQDDHGAKWEIGAYVSTAATAGALTVVTTHPYPALGIATSRVVAQQTTNTYSHSADFGPRSRTLCSHAGDTDYSSG